MEIKRKTEIFIETRRQFVINHPETGKRIFCPQCRETMLAAEQAAEFFGMSRRRIYQFIENETAHFTELETGAVMICIASLAAVLQANDEKITSENQNGTDTNLEIFKELEEKK